MEAQLLNEVLACLCGERTVFHYYPDQYAVYLLSRQLEKRNGLPIREIKQSQWSGLLKRPALADVVAHCGDGKLYHQDLTDLWLAEPEPFVLTLDSWGSAKNWSWDQTSRPGKNIVLQLNLSAKWSRRFKAATKEVANEFLGYLHPHSSRRPATLAWARMDIEFDTNEVLIEEIQTDLVREVIELRQRALDVLRYGYDSFWCAGHSLPVKPFLEFAEEFLRQFKKTWQEAMLTAALHFAFDELGIATVYYHSFNTGNQLKNIQWRKPPKSLYTELPKKFCFQKTHEAPKLLQQEKRIKRKLKKMEDKQWFYLEA